MFCDLVGNVARFFTSINGGGSKFSPFLDGSGKVAIACHIAN